MSAPVHPVSTATAAAAAATTSINCTNTCTCTTCTSRAFALTHTRTLAEGEEAIPVVVSMTQVVAAYLAIHGRDAPAPSPQELTSMLDVLLEFVPEPINQLNIRARFRSSVPIHTVQEYEGVLKYALDAAGMAFAEIVHKRSLNISDIDTARAMVTSVEFILVTTEDAPSSGSTSCASDTDTDTPAPAPASAPVSKERPRLLKLMCRPPCTVLMKSYYKLAGMKYPKNVLRQDWTPPADDAPGTELLKRTSRGYAFPGANATFKFPAEGVSTAPCWFSLLCMTGLGLDEDAEVGPQWESLGRREVLLAVTDNDNDVGDKMYSRAQGSDASTFEESEEFLGYLEHCRPIVRVSYRKQQQGRVVSPEEGEATKTAVMESLPPIACSWFMRAPYMGMYTITPLELASVMDMVATRAPNCLLINPQEYDQASGTLMFHSSNLGSLAVSVEGLILMLTSVVNSLDLVIFTHPGMTGVASRVSTHLHNAHVLAWDSNSDQPHLVYSDWTSALSHRMRLVRLVLKYIMYRPCLQEAMEFANLYLDVTRGHAFNKHGALKEPGLPCYDVTEEERAASASDFKQRTVHLQTLWRMCIHHQDLLCVLPIRFLYDAIEDRGVTCVEQAQDLAADLHKRKENVWRASAKNPYPPSTFDWCDAVAFAKRRKLPSKFYFQCYSKGLEEATETAKREAAKRATDSDKPSRKPPVCIPNWVL